MNNQNKTFRNIDLIFSAIFAFQLMVFIILMIQTSDSKGFKALVGFVGIPMAVTSVVMGMVKKTDEEQNTKINWYKIITLLSLIYVVINFFYLFYSNYKQFHLLYEASVLPGSIALLSSLLGGIVVGTRVTIVNPAKEGAGFTIARIVLIILFLIIFVKIYYPTLIYLIAVFTNNKDLFTSLNFNSFNSSLLRNVGNIYEWHLNFIVAAFVQYSFYHKFWWKGSISNANKKSDENY